MGRAHALGWWLVEVGVPALAVLTGVLLLGLAVLLQISGAISRAEQMQVFLLGVGCWAGGIAWGALVNNGIPGLRDP